nr:putative phage tail protein [uncultured Acetatifactor sp.]
MLVFNNQQRNGYEEIASYSPRYYRGIKEMDAVFRLEGWLIGLMAQDMEDVVAFQFLKHMDDEALDRYEAFLGVVSDADRSIDERKAYISALLIGSGKLSADKIIEIVGQFRGCDCESVSLEGSTLHISIIADKDFDQQISNGMCGLIKGKIPAHIAMDAVFYSALSGKMYFGGAMEQADIIEIRQR